MESKFKHGGPRKPGPGKRLGAPPLPKHKRRPPASARFAPGTVDLAKAIAKAYGLRGWARVMDLAVAKLVELDPDLKRDLAKMGVVIK